MMPEEAAGADTLVCPFCGHVISPRDPEKFAVKAEIFCGACHRRFRNPLYSPPSGDTVPEAEAAVEGLEMKCPHCGYTWLYKGRTIKPTEKRRVQCPGCYRTFKNPYVKDEQVERKKEGVSVRCRKCKHKWIYTGAMTYLNRIKCPSCGAYNPELVEEQEEKEEKVATTENQ